MDFAEAVEQFDRALIALAHGDYINGFADYESRLIVHPQPACSIPRWHGEPLNGKTIVLEMEQGIGDGIQFLRYAPMVKARGAGRVLVTFSGPSELLARCPGVDEVLWPDKPALADVRAALGSLPGIFGTRLDSIPGAVPYLFANEQLAALWSRAVNQVAEGRFKVGICWQGSPDNVADATRSIPLDAFAPLAMSGVCLIVLQKDHGLDQLARHRFPTVQFDRLDEDRGPFEDTAAIMRNLDLVVTADTSIAHLAGAMGVPVWIALSARPDWRWLLNRDDSPWYPTAKLFRQERLGEWGPVFELMAGELTSRIAVQS